MSADRRQSAIVIKDALCADVKEWNRAFDAGDEARADELRAEMQQSVLFEAAERAEDGSWRWEWGLAGPHLGSCTIRLTGPVADDGEIADAVLQYVQDGCWVNLECTEEEQVLLYDAALFSIGNCASLIEVAEEELKEDAPASSPPHDLPRVRQMKIDGVATPHNIAVLWRVLEENGIGGLVVAFGGEAGEGHLRIDFPKADWIFALRVEGLLEVGEQGEGVVERPGMRMDDAMELVGAEILSALYQDEWKAGDGTLGRIAFSNGRTTVWCGVRELLAVAPTADWDRVEIEGREYRAEPEDEPGL